MTTLTDDTPKPKRTILYCRKCCWAGETTRRGVDTSGCPMPECNKWGLSYVRFHEHEKAQASEVLMSDIGKSVDDVKPYEET